MQTLHTTLGGGANGHLGLVCNTSTYASIPGTTAYVPSVNPGPLVAARTAVQIAQARDQHKEDL
eukprot:13099855-Ditylum_brightwellii.AAC.1